MVATFGLQFWTSFLASGWARVVSQGHLLIAGFTHACWPETVSPHIWGDTFSKQIISIINFRSNRTSKSYIQEKKQTREKDLRRNGNFYIYEVLQHVGDVKRELCFGTVSAQACYWPFLMPTVETPMINDLRGTLKYILPQQNALFMLLLISKMDVTSQQTRTSGHSIPKMATRYRK